MRRFQDEISGKGSDRINSVRRSREIARRCTYHTRKKRGNTDLLTCVMGQTPLRPRPAFSQIFSAMADFRPGGSKPLRRGLTRTAPFRVGLKPASLPTLLKERCGIGVYYGISIFSSTKEDRPQVPADVKGRPFTMILCAFVCYHIRFFAIWQANSCFSPFFHHVPNRPESVQ